MSVGVDSIASSFCVLTFLLLSFFFCKSDGVLICSCGVCFEANASTSNFRFHSHCEDTFNDWNSPALWTEDIRGQMEADSLRITLIQALICWDTDTPPGHHQMEAVAPLCSGWCRWSTFLYNQLLFPLSHSHFVHQMDINDLFCSSSQSIGSSSR